MVRNQHHPFRKPILDPPIRQLADLAPHTLIPGDIDARCRPPLRHGKDKEGHGLLGAGHVAVVGVPVEDVEGHANVLGDCYAGGEGF